PSVSLSASWSGFTQRFTDINPIITGQQLQYGSLLQDCQDENQIRTNAGLATRSCTTYQWGASQEQALRDQNSQYPFNFTQQPFQARLTVTLPLWTNMARPLQVSQARAQHQDLEESVRARGLAVQTEVSQAYLTRRPGANAKRGKGIEVGFEKGGQRDLVAAVTASGKVQPKKKVDVSADITGRITRLAVREGDFVRKGQFLLQIDPTIYQANLQRAEATLASAQAGLVQAQANREQAKRQLGRTKELHEQNPNLVSPEQLEQAQTAYNVAEAIANSSGHQVDQARAGVQEA